MVLDLSFVYEETKKLYCHRYGRPPIDPVILVKYLLVGYLYGIPPERQIEQRIQTDVALRWYLGLDLFDRVPDHSAISPAEHWTRIRTNNLIERLNREFRRRTRVVGCFPDGNSALMLVCARLRHVASTQWGNKKYMSMKHLGVSFAEASVAG